MKNVLVIIFVVFGASAVALLEETETCITPNQENGICIPVLQCGVFIDVMVKFASLDNQFDQQSQCADDLVCCRSTGYPLSLHLKSSIPEPKNRLQNLEPYYYIKNLPNGTICGLHKEKRNRIHGIGCDGSVISQRYILTAAHCIYDIEFELIVRLGKWDITRDPDCYEDVDGCADLVQNYTIGNLIPKGYNNMFKRNDIELLKLDRDIIFTDSIRLICLPMANAELDTKMTVTGWSITETGNTSNLKLKVEVTLPEHNFCLENLNESLSAQQLCSGGITRKDSCEEDSGAALITKYQDETRLQWFQEGIVAWGSRRAHGSCTTVYTSIMGYFDWILSIIKRKSSHGQVS